MDVLAAAMGSDDWLTRAGLAQIAQHAQAEKRDLRDVSKEMARRAKDGRVGLDDALARESMLAAVEMLGSGKVDEGVLKKYRTVLVGRIGEAMASENADEAKRAIDASQWIGVELTVFEAGYARAARSHEAGVRGAACTALRKLGARSVGYFVAMAQDRNEGIACAGLEQLSLMAETILQVKETANEVMRVAMGALFDESDFVERGGRVVLKSLGERATKYAEQRVLDVEAVMASVGRVMDWGVVGFGGEGARMRRLVRGMMREARGRFDAVIADGIPGMTWLKKEWVDRRVALLRDPSPANRRLAARQLSEYRVLPKKVADGLVASVDAGDFACREGLVAAIERARRGD